MGATADSTCVIISELLTYINHCSRKGHDIGRIASIASHFFTQDEVNGAKGQLSEHWDKIIGKTGKPARIKQVNKNQPDATVKLNEVTWMCQTIAALDATLSNVVFACNNLDRLPPREETGMETYILNIKMAQIEDQLQSVIKYQETSQSVTEKLDTVDKIAKTLTSKSYASALTAGLPQYNGGNQRKFNHESAQRKIKPRPNNAVIGKKKTENEEFKTVRLLRPQRAHIFVSRLPKSADEGTIQEWLSQNDLKWEDIEKLPERFDGQTYASFHLTLLKGDHDYDDFLNPDIWPEGALIKRWFFPRKWVTPPETNFISESKQHMSITAGHDQHQGNQTADQDES